MKLAGLIILAFCLSLGAASVKAHWLPSISTNVAGYCVYYGTASRVYSTRIDCGLTNCVTITNLPAPDPGFYFAVTAYDASTNESVFSNEAYWPMAGPQNLQILIR